MIMNWIWMEKKHEHTAILWLEITINVHTTNEKLKKTHTHIKNGKKNKRSHNE